MDTQRLYLKSALHGVITLYLRKETPKLKVLKLLKQEEILIENIQSRQTRNEISEAFVKLKTFIAKLPEEHPGLVIVVNSKEIVYSDDIPISQDLYRCGNEFYAAPLEQELAVKLHPIGIITLDTKEATIARIGSTIEILKYMTSGIPGKHSKGGSSQRRFERDRETKIWAFFQRIADVAKIFLVSHPIEELLISGCGQTKDDFLKAKYLDYRLKEKVTMVLDTQYTEEFGIRETLHKALPQLKKNAFAQEIKIVDDFFNALAKRFDSVVYGKEEVKRQFHQIKSLIVIEELKDEYPKDMYPNITILCFRGEHYQKIQSLGGVVGFKEA